MYPVGWPLWRLLARLGVPLRFALLVHFDRESHTFWAESPDIDGLVVEGKDIGEVCREALLAADLLLEMQLHTARAPKLHISPQLDMSPQLATA